MPCVRRGQGLALFAFRFQPRSVGFPLRSALASFLFLAVLSVALRFSEAEEAPPPANHPVLLEPVVVTATRLPEPLIDVPAALSIVDKTAIQDARPTVSLDEPLDRVPGVFVQNSGNFAQDFRIQIRGFGTRAGFGTREIRVLVDGLPETLPDGQTQLDSLDLDAIDRIEVLRSPASSLYGNASGGVIQLFTEDGPDQPSASVRLSGGSFDFQKYAIKGGGRAGGTRLFVQSSYFSLDGFRDHSATQSTIANLKLSSEVTDGTTVTLLFNGVDSPLAQDPGALTRAEADADPRQARSLNIRQDAGESVQQARLGATLAQRLETGQLSAYAYGIYRDFDNRLPIPPDVPPVLGGIVTFTRFSPGGGAQYTLATPVYGSLQQLTAGVDVQYQDDDRRRFANQGGQRGALGLEQRERVTSVGPYVQEQVFVGDALQLSAGLRYDSVHYDVDVQQPPDSGDSGSRTLDAWSPAAGVRYTLQPGLVVFANVGTGFQVPTTTEFANPSGPGFNPNLGPQKAVSYEIGARHDSARVQAGLAAFLINLRDELIPYELPDQPERTFFRNAGRSRRYGLEIDWQAFIVPPLRWTSALTLIDTEFVDYTTPAGSFAGNAEPGIPSWQMYNELFYRHSSGAFVAFEAFAVDSYFVDDANQFQSPGYALLTLRGGLERTYGPVTVAPFVGFNNLLDQNYAGTVRLNATMERFFEPAPGFNVYGGVIVSARL